jgi:hypothetical protein
MAGAGLEPMGDLPKLTDIASEGTFVCGRLLLWPSRCLSSQGLRVTDITAQIRIAWLAAAPS